jgi:hypothetical protein
MTSWLAELQKAVGGRGNDIEPLGFLALLAASALAAFVVAQLYSRFYGHRASGSEIHRSFPLLGIAITAIFICIQFSLPLSLGLLGALSIVRFRTPIKEPEEIGFLMVVIATSLASATGRLLYLALVLVAAAVGLLVQEMLGPIFRRRRDSGLVIATYAEADYSERGAALLATLAAAGRRGALESLTTQEGRVTITWRFSGLAPDAAPELERKLSAAARPESLAIVFAAGAP